MIIGVVMMLKMEGKNNRKCNDIYRKKQQSAMVLGNAIEITFKYNNNRKYDHDYHNHWNAIF